MTARISGVASRSRKAWSYLHSRRRTPSSPAGWRRSCPTSALIVFCARYSASRIRVSVDASRTPLTAANPSALIVSRARASQSESFLQSITGVIGSSPHRVLSCSLAFGSGQGQEVAVMHGVCRATLELKVALEDLDHLSLGPGMTSLIDPPQQPARKPGLRPDGIQEE